MPELSSVLCAPFSKNSALCCCLKILVKSFKVFPRNKCIFFFIFILFTLPLSLLHFSLSLSSYPIKSQILHLELVATRAATHFESRQIWRDSREIALSLFHLKLLYFVPSYFLSIMAAITVVASTESDYNKRSPTVSLIFSAVKSTWLRPLLTSFYIYAILLIYSSIPHTLLTVIGRSSLPIRLVIWLVGTGVELYLMAVLGLALVASIIETTSGWDAIQIGWRLIEGRRICGWFLFGIMAIVTAGIGYRMEGLMVVGNDSGEEVKWVETQGWKKAILVGFYGVVIMWGFVMTTVSYFECMKVNFGRRSEEIAEEQELQEQEEQSLDC